MKLSCLCSTIALKLALIVSYITISTVVPSWSLCTYDKRWFFWAAHPEANAQAYPWRMVQVEFLWTVLNDVWEGNQDKSKDMQ